MVCKDIEIAHVPRNFMGLIRSVPMVRESKKRYPLKAKVKMNTFSDEVFCATKFVKMADFGTPYCIFSKC